MIGSSPPSGCARASLKIGGLFINKETGGSHFNRTIAADATFALRRHLTINSFIAKTSTPGLSGGDTVFYGRIGWLDPAWNLFAQYIDIQDDFQRRSRLRATPGIRSTKVHIAPTPRPKQWHIRVMEPMLDVTYTTDQHNRLVTRRVHHMLGVRLDNGTWINVIYNGLFEQLDEPFRIRRDVAVPPGTYRFGEWIFELNSDPSRRVYEQSRYTPQTFYGGTRKDLDASVGVRGNAHFSAELRYRRNDVSLPAGAFVVNLGLLQRAPFQPIG